MGNRIGANLGASSIEKKELPLSFCPKLSIPYILQKYRMWVNLAILGLNQTGVRNFLKIN